MHKSWQVASTLNFSKCHCFGFFFNNVICFYLRVEWLNYFYSKATLIIISLNDVTISFFILSYAGIGEVCSHVRALLFAIEASVKIRNTKTVTEEKAYWMLPQAVKNVEYKRAQNIDFTSAKTNKKSWTCQFKKIPR